MARSRGRTPALATGSLVDCKDWTGATMTVETSAPRRPSEPRESHARGWRGLGWGVVAKLLMMALVNALGLSIILSAINVEAWGILTASTVLLIAADVVYFMKRTLPLKYIFPGLVFLFVFQVF